MGKVTKPVMLDETGKQILEALTQSELTQERIAEINRAAEEAKIDVINTSEEAIQAVETTVNTAKNEVEEKVNQQLGRIPEVTEIHEEVSQIKSELSDLSDTVIKEVKGENLFFPPTSITEGKYLNPNTGNAGSNENYLYVNDYYPVEPNSSYYGLGYYKSTHELAGSLGAFLCFYDSNKNFISGTTMSSSDARFVTPNNCKFIRFSQSKNAYNNYLWYLGKGDSYTGVKYEPYHDKTVINSRVIPYTIVDADGYGDYVSINEAVQNAEDGDTIYVMSGEYIETVRAWGKTVNIIGTSKETCILKQTNGGYTMPPLEMCSGSIENMTIVSDCNDTSKITESMGAYAIHIDNNYSSDKRLLIRNCIIKSNTSSAVGIGMRKGFDLVFENCFIECSEAFASTGAAPLYFHDADQTLYFGVSNITVRNCILKNTSDRLFSMLTINSIHAENTTYMNFNHNIFTQKNKSVQKFNTWTTGGGTYDGFNGLRNMYLTDECYGNNLAELNK